MNKYFLRNPSEVMNIERLGAMHQTRLSFSRALLSSIKKNKWKITNAKWDTDKNAFGTIVYNLKTPNDIYNLVIFSNHIEDEQRNDRVISECWDITCAFVQGKLSDKFIQNLKENTPLQEKGRYNNKVLSISRANKSMRVFNHIIDSLSKGLQPDISLLQQVGYIMRTTAVYGNGKFGIQDFNYLKDNKDFKCSFFVQMCLLYMLREFSFDLISFLSKQKGGTKTVPLELDYKRFLGVGNATGLGMALFLIRHPKVINKWLTVREKTLTSITKEKTNKKDKSKIISILKKAIIYLDETYTIDEHQKKLNLIAENEIKKIINDIEKDAYNLEWDKIIKYNRKYSLEAQEIFISCLFEIYPNIVDNYIHSMNSSEDCYSIAGVSVNDLIKIIKNKYKWVLDIDFNKKNSKYWFWYISQNKSEPRLGVRSKDAGVEKEIDLDIARQISKLYQKLIKSNFKETISNFLINNEKFSKIALRVWTIGNCDMGEIQANIIAKDFMPIHLLRCKLSILGAKKFDPRSDKWVRVTFFQNAPIASEIEYNDNCLFKKSPKVKNYASIL